MGGMDPFVPGAIMKNGRLLMAHNDRDDYLYTVDGRVKFGETAEEAVEEVKKAAEEAVGTRRRRGRKQE